MISNKLLVALSFSTLLANSAFCSDINPAADNTSPRTAITASEAPNPEVKQVSYQDAFKTYFSTDYDGDEGTPPALMLMEPSAVRISDLLKRIEYDRVKLEQERATQRILKEKTQRTLQDLAQKQKHARKNPTEYQTYLTNEIKYFQNSTREFNGQMREYSGRIQGVMRLLEIIDNPSHPEYNIYAHHRREDLEGRLHEDTLYINTLRTLIEHNSSFINVYNREIELLLAAFPALNIQHHHNFAH